MIQSKMWTTKVRCHAQSESKEPSGFILQLYSSHVDHVLRKLGWVLLRTAVSFSFTMKQGFPRVLDWVSDLGFFVGTLGCTFLQSALIASLLLRGHSCKRRSIPYRTVRVYRHTQHSSAPSPLLTVLIGSSMSCCL